jgi:hypothetical protein
MKTTLIIFCSLILLACNNSKKKLICHMWQATNLYNPKLDLLIAQTKADIDTIGNEDAIIKASVNVDSFRKMLQSQLDADLYSQKISLENTSYEFKENGITFIKTIEGVDSAKWYLESDNVLRIDEPALTGMGDVQDFNIVQLDDNNMKLQMVLNGDTSIMTFKKANK